jgi:hypothetical protein
VIVSVTRDRIVVVKLERESSMQHPTALTLLPVAALMMDEAAEFEMLDALPPFDDSGNVAWIFEGEPTSRREKRWLELYTKLSAASAISSRSLGACRRLTLLRH